MDWSLIVEARFYTPRSFRLTWQQRLAKSNRGRAALKRRAADPKPAPFWGLWSSLREHANPPNHPFSPEVRSLGPDLGLPHLLWRPSQLAQLADAQRIMPLGQSHAGLIAYEVAVIVIGNLELQRPTQQNLPRR